MIHGPERRDLQGPISGTIERMLKLVIPKGSLEAQTLALFEAADVRLVRGSDRDYHGTVDDPRIERFSLLRPQEIPRYVEDGFFDLGLTGLDWVLETGASVATGQAVEEIKILILGAINARGKVLMKLNVEEGDLSAVLEQLPSMRAPTVSRLADQTSYAVETVVEKKVVNVLIPTLKALGATDILELPISKIVE